MTTVSRPTRERRSGPRTKEQGRVTGLIQSILKDASGASAHLESELRSGGDPAATHVLLAEAESLASLRGIDLGAQVASIRRQLKRAGFSA